MMIALEARASALNRLRSWPLTRPCFEDDPPIDGASIK
jgi:hypothetical protein